VQRYTISEVGQPPLPAVDLDEPRVVIGSGAGARIRLPGAAAAGEHVELTRAGWRALAEVRVDGATRTAGAAGPIGDGVDIEVAPYRVRIEPSPGGTAATPLARTESLARELVRSLLGAGAAPTLEIERGPAAGATRALPPPESALVIGRGDDAGWVLLDEDLSRMHAEVRRGWDGVTIRDLGSKNGTIVDGAVVDGAGVMLRDGAGIELGNVVLRFRDPAERHLRGEPAAAAAAAAGAGAAGAAEAAERAKAAGAKTAGAGVAAKAAAGAARAAAGSPRAGVGATRAAAGSPVPPLWIAVGAFTLAGLALAGLVWVLAG